MIVNDCFVIYVHLDSSNVPADYKFYCFNGEPKFIRVKKHINGINLNNIYNLNWTLTELDLKYLNFVREPKIKIPKPINLQKQNFEDNNRA